MCVSGLICEAERHFQKVMRFKGFIHDTRGWGQRFFQGGQSGMNSLLAPGLHPFSPHFSPQKSGKPETFSVNRQTVEEEKKIVVCRDI